MRGPPAGPLGICRPRPSRCGAGWSASPTATRSSCSTTPVPSRRSAWPGSTRPRSARRSAGVRRQACLAWSTTGRPVSSGPRWTATVARSARSGLQIRAARPRAARSRWTPTRRRSPSAWPVGTATKPAPEDRGRYEFAETDSSARRSGLWSDPPPTSTWDWQRDQRQSSRTRQGDPPSGACPRSVGGRQRRGRPIWSWAAHCDLPTTAARPWPASASWRVLCCCPG